MGCSPHLNLVQRTRELGETEEELDQDEHHSVESLHVPDTEESNISLNVEEEESIIRTEAEPAEPVAETTSDSERKERINWPSSTMKSVWQSFEEEVDKVLEATLAGNVEKKLEGMANIIYTMGKERFGLVERKQPQTVYSHNRRAKKISEVRKGLKDLKRRYRMSSEEEKLALSDLREDLRKQLKTLRRAENHRRKRIERQRKRAQFIANPFGFVKKLLGSKKSGKLECTREEANMHVRQMYSDATRDEDLGECQKLLSPEPPEIQFEEKEPTLQEVRRVLQKARAASAPGPNGIPYKIYKCCQRLAQRLWKLLKVVWRKGELPVSWMLAEGCFIPKEENAKTLGQFRTISLLNVEVKIFLAVLAKRTTSFLLANKYVDTSVQKGGVPGISGCLEHTSVLTQIIKEAKQSKGDLAVIWLDLAKAYGTVPHKLVDKKSTTI